MANKKISIACENCKKKFFVKQPKKKLHKDGLEGIITIYYIECSNCNKKYVSFVENEKIKAMVKENKALHKKLATIRDEQEYLEAQEEFEKNVSRIDTLRKDLIFRFSKYV